MCYPFVIPNAKIQGKTVDTGNIKREVIDFGAITTADKIILWSPSKKIRITGAKHVSKATLSTSDTNFVAAGIINKGAAGSGTGVVINVATASNSNKATGGAALTAYVPNNLTVLTTSNVNVIAANDVLELTADVGGTIAPADYQIWIDYVEA
jgi:hypothetical protein